MAASKPQAVDPVASYVRRRDNFVVMVLQLPGSKLDGGVAHVQLISERGKAQTRAKASAVGKGVQVKAKILAKRVPPDTWALAVQFGDNAFKPLEARILTSRTQPIALITGPAGGPSINPDPKPNPRHRVAAQAGRAIDLALSPLPPKLTKPVRSALRKMARAIPS